MLIMLNQNFVERFSNKGNIGFAFFLVIAACSSEDPEFVINVDNLDIKFVDETDPPGFCGYGLVDPPRVQIKQSGLLEFANRY